MHGPPQVPIFLGGVEGCHGIRGARAAAGAGYLGPFLKAFSGADYLVSYFEGVFGCMARRRRRLLGSLEGCHRMLGPLPGAGAGVFGPCKHHKTTQEPPPHPPAPMLQRGADSTIHNAGTPVASVIW